MTILPHLIFGVCFFIMVEIWKEVDGYEGKLRVSNYGNVFKVITNKLANKNLNNRGYLRVCIEKKHLYIHRLVCEHFIHSRREDQTSVNHINGIKTDNRVENLEWVTPRENTFHYRMTNKTHPYVSYSEKTDRYESWLSVNGKSRRIGRFKTLEEAECAYLEKIKKEGINIKYLQ